MKDKHLNTNKLHISKFVYLVVFFLFLVFAISLGYRCLVDYKATKKVTISEFIKDRNIVEEVILPERGTIYDANNNVLAQDVSSYTLIAYLDESRSTEDKIRHVKDKEKTAKELAKYIDVSYERILEILNKDAYQVEFGPGTKSLSQLEMEAIKELNLPGIDFIKSTKRYYPNGDFASYLLGYTVNKELDDGNTYMVGELGIESTFNEELTGVSGYITYEQDRRGNVIANSNQYTQDAINGSDVYLTIDSNIQLFIENEMQKVKKNSKAEWALIAVMDAKTGAILGYTSSPSYDPNIRNLSNYRDPLVSFTYEPGSTMKTFSYMCAIESGRYNGSDTYLSGSKTYVSEINPKDTVTIKDWNEGKGWGRISYDFGFAMSSNIGVANLLENVITKKELRACYDSYGFGKKTGITLDGEAAGVTKFTYDVEAATAGYGQGITITPIQMLQGLSIIANDGTMIKPYVVSKIVDPDGNVILENKREEIAKVASTETVEKMKSLLRSIACGDSRYCTGSSYRMDGYDLIGKTGTAYIWENGKYTVGDGNYIYSFAGLYPGNDPDIIIYAVQKKPKDNNYSLPGAVKQIVLNTSKYLNLEDEKTELKPIKLISYANQSTSQVKKELESNGIKVVTLGTGSKIINQYPSSGINVYKGDLVVLLTNDYNNTMPNLVGLSYKEAKNILDLMGVKYKTTGYGYVVSQSITAGDKVTEEVTIELKEIY